MLEIILIVLLIIILTFFLYKCLYQANNTSLNKIWIATDDFCKESQIKSCILCISDKEYLLYMLNESGEDDIEFGKIQIETNSTITFTNNDKDEGILPNNCIAKLKNKQLIIYDKQEIYGIFESMK